MCLRIKARLQAPSALCTQWRVHAYALLQVPLVPRRASSAQVCLWCSGVPLVLRRVHNSWCSCLLVYVLAILSSVDEGTPSPKPSGEGECVLPYKPDPNHSQAKVYPLMSH